MATEFAIPPGSDAHYECDGVDLDDDGVEIDNHKKTINGRFPETCSLRKGKTDTNVPPQIAMQLHSVYTKQPFFDYYMKRPVVFTKRQLSRAARRCVLALNAYNPNIKRYDRIYGGKIIKIVRVNSHTTNRGPDGRGTEQIDTGGLLGYTWISNDKKEIAINMRGTMDEPNWGINFNLAAIDTANIFGDDPLCQGEIHGGMFHAVHDYQSKWKRLFINPQTDKPWKSISRKGTIVTLNGHSLGSALGKVILIEIYCNPAWQDIKDALNRKGVRVNSFGPPAILHTNFRDNIRKLAKYNKHRILEWVSPKDPICRVGTAANEFWSAVLYKGSRSFPWESHNYVYKKLKTNKAQFSSLLKQGLGDTLRYQHLGVVYKTEKSQHPYEKDYGVDMIAHDQYFFVDVASFSHPKEDSYREGFTIRTAGRSLLAASNSFQVDDDVSHAAFYSIMIAVFISFVFSLLFAIQRKYY